MVVIVFLFVLARAMIVVNEGQEALVYFSGRYLRTLGPGMHLINPNFRVVRLGGRQELPPGFGAIGTLAVATEPNTLAGRITIDGKPYVARSSRPLPAGATVRVVSPPQTISVVEVVPVDEAARPLN